MFHRFFIRICIIGLKKLGIGAFHVGVEVYGDEWCFQYYIDQCNNPQLTGVARTPPKQHQGFLYRETVDMGSTRYTRAEVDRIVSVRFIFGLLTFCHLGIERSVASFELSLNTEKLR